MKADNKEKVVVVFESVSGFGATERRFESSSNLIVRNIDEFRSLDSLSVESLEKYLVCGSYEEALSLLKKLNGLSDSTGAQYSSKVRWLEFLPWWFHQDLAFQYFLFPFTRFRPLIDRLNAFSHITIYDCPQDLKHLLDLLGFSSRLDLKFQENLSKKSSRQFVFAKEICASFYYWAVSFLAILIAVFKRPKVLLYTIDKTSVRKPFDERIESLYENLQKYSISFLEVVWSSNARRAVNNFSNRRRFCIYLQGIAPFFKGVTPRAQGEGVYELSSATIQDTFLKKLAQNIMIPAANHSIKVMKRLRWVLNIWKPQCGFFIDDHRHVHEAVVACKLLSIPTIGLQHGQFNRYTVGLMAYGLKSPSLHSFDRYCVWSKFFKTQLLQQGNLYKDESVFVGGTFRANEMRKRSPDSQNCHTKPGERVRVLVICEQYTSDIQEREVYPYLQALYSDSRISVVLKLHPSQANAPTSLLNRSDQARLEVKIGPMDQALGETSVVLASYSSAVFDAIMCEKPVVLFPTSLYDDPHGLVKAGVAFNVRHPGEVVEEVLHAGTIPSDRLKENRKIVWGEEFLNGGESAIKEMKNLLTIRSG